MPYFLLLVANCCLGSRVHAQNLPASSYDSSFRFYYYDQKLSMFEQMAQRQDAIVWLGDSITDGCEWNELFPGYTMLNRGISADNTFGILHRLYEVVHRKPAKIFLLIGINDIARNIPVDIILRNYAAIIATIQKESPVSSLYVQTLLPTNGQFKDFPNHQHKTDKVLEVNAGIRHLAKANGVELIDLYPAFCNADGALDVQYTNDGLHLTGAGYQHWKKIVIAHNALK